MHFAHGYLLNFLLVVIPVTVFFYWGKRHHQQKMEKVAESKLLGDLARRFDPLKADLKRVLIGGAVVLSIIALSRPRWGFEWREVKRQGLDIMVVIDTSRSMLTTDVKPNRLERTKLAVKDLLKNLKGDRIGLIAFSGDAFLVCPLTVDYQGFLLSLNDLNTSTIPRGGTNLASAIEKSISAYKDVPSQYKAIIIVTDGDDLEGDPLSMAKKARELGMKIYTIGIGTKEGELIQFTDQDGKTAFLKDRGGNFVKSRLNETLLEKIALLTDGVYAQSSGAQFGLDLIYDRNLSKLEKREIEQEMEKRYFERFQIPLAMALLLLVIETCLTTRKK